MNNPKQIMEVKLSPAISADLAVRAARRGVSTSEYLEFLVLMGAYGASHPAVKEFRSRPNPGVSGTKTTV